MINAITVKHTLWFINLQKKVMYFLVFLHNLKEKQKPFFIRGAVVYMSVKIGLILLATCATMFFIITSVTPHLAAEMSKSQALLFASPLTLIIMLKVYFIGKILLTYDRSRLVMKSVVDKVFLKGKQGILSIKGALPANLSSLSLEKARIVKS